MTEVFVIALMIGVNALYVAAEFSVVGIRKTQLVPLVTDGNEQAKGLLRLQEDGVELDRYIAACQIGITISSLVAGAYAQARLAPHLGAWLRDQFSWTAATASSTAFTIILLVLTTLQVVLGELVPKSLAMQFPERTALLTYLPTRWSVSLYRWFIWLLNGSGFILLKPFGVTPRGHQQAHSLQEIRILLQESQKGGELSSGGLRLLDRGLHLSSRTVRQMMTPRNEIYAIEVSTPSEDALQRILESPYSRIPVYQGSLDQILGAVNTRDLVDWFALHEELPPPLDVLLRKIPFVPENLRAPHLVRFLQRQQSSKAIVVDEFGGVQGIISIEDVLAHLFGDIGDELKQPELEVEQQEDGTVRLPGSLALDKAEPWLGTHWDGKATTLGGYIVAHLGRWPRAGESLEIDGVSMTVTETSPTAVLWIVVEPRQKSDDAEASPSSESKEEA